MDMKSVVYETFIGQKETFNG